MEEISWSCWLDQLEVDISMVSIELLILDLDFLSILAEILRELTVDSICACHLQESFDS